MCLEERKVIYLQEIRDINNLARIPTWLQERRTHIVWSFHCPKAWKIIILQCVVKAYRISVVWAAPMARYQSLGTNLHHSNLLATITADNKLSSWQCVTPTTGVINTKWIVIHPLTKGNPPYDQELTSQAFLTLLQQRKLVTLPKNWVLLHAVWFFGPDNNIILVSL